jgi:hypothetical protein
VLATIPNPKLGDIQILKLFQGLAFLPSLQKKPNESVKFGCEECFTLPYSLLPFFKSFHVF